MIKHRRSILFAGYDYASEGMYFITLVTHHREHLFGSVVDGEMILNEYGRIVREEWFRSAEIRKEIELDNDEFIIMPNHIHGIVQINESMQTVNIENDAGDLVRAYDRTLTTEQHSQPDSEDLSNSSLGIQSQIPCQQSLAHKNLLLQNE